MDAERIAQIFAAVEDIDDPPDGAWGLRAIRELLAEGEALREALRLARHAPCGLCPDDPEGKSHSCASGWGFPFKGCNCIGCAALGNEALEHVTIEGMAVEEDEDNLDLLY